MAHKEDVLRLQKELSQLREIFFPRASKEIDRMRKYGTRLAHYTTAETGLKILHSNEIFLRNATLMNDFSEMRYGMDCLGYAYSGQFGMRLKAALRDVQDDLPDILARNFDNNFIDVRSETYLMSVSEHDDGHEDRYGRLSMWRAYAPKNGVAFILNNRPFVSNSDALNAYTSPVLYATREDFQTAFEEVVISIENNLGYLKSIGGRYVHDMLMTAFRFAVQSTKHPAFKEEKEWRVIYTPTLLPENEAKKQKQLMRVPAKIMSLGGVPQKVYTIPLRDYPDEDFIGATVPELLDRVLIGPSQDSYAIAQAYIAELKRRQVPNAESKVIITDIPLRH
ncbi:MAG TPA: hypothetical protein DIS96_09515 [Pusillimonas sp.]|nr:hypothetical protein [Pusillimonas sp.]